MCLTHRNEIGKPPPQDLLNKIKLISTKYMKNQCRHVYGCNKYQMEASYE